MNAREALTKAAEICQRNTFMLSCCQDGCRLAKAILALRDSLPEEKVPEGMILVSVDEIDRIARDCEHGSRIWRVCDDILRRYRLAAAPKPD